MSVPKTSGNNASRSGTVVFGARNPNEPAVFAASLRTDDRRRKSGSFSSAAAPAVRNRVISNGTAFLQRAGPTGDSPCPCRRPCPCGLSGRSSLRAARLPALPDTTGRQAGSFQGARPPFPSREFGVPVASAFPRSAYFRRCCGPSPRRRPTVGVAGSTLFLALLFRAARLSEPLVAESS